MSPNAAHILHLFGFEQLPTDGKRGVTRWHYGRTIPQCCIELPTDTTPHDIRDALVSYGSVLPIAPPASDLLLDNDGAPLIEPAESSSSLLARPIPF